MIGRKHSFVGNPFQQRMPFTDVRKVVPTTAGHAADIKRIARRDVHADGGWMRQMLNFFPRPARSPPTTIRTDAERRCWQAQTAFCGHENIPFMHVPVANLGRNQ